MKKLYENIENIHITGGIDQLSDVVRVMDMSLQNIADITDRLTGFLIKYSSSNKGKQYQKVVQTTLTLRDEMFDASVELNDMQKQIVTYQNKIYRYEDMTASAQQPNQLLIQKRPINVETTIVQFNRSDMLEVNAALRNYSERVFHHIKTINEKKNSIASVWKDSQYNDFAEFINEVTRSVVIALREYENYIIYLEEKIKELS